MFTLLWLLVFGSQTYLYKESFDINIRSSKISINTIEMGIGIGQNIEYSFHRYLQVMNNKLTHSLRGNKSTCKGLNIMHIISNDKVKKQLRHVSTYTKTINLT